MRLASRRRLQLATALAGCVFSLCAVDGPSLPFAQLPRAFPTSFRDRRGFFHVLRWLEQVHAAEDLGAFLSAIAAFNAESTDAKTSTSPFRNADELLARIVLVVRWETYLLVSKVVLQWGLLLFLARTKAITTRVAIPSVCLCVLSLICAKITQSSVVEILSTWTVPVDAKRATFMAAFIDMMFMVRFTTTALVSAVMGRAYQAYFGGWPARWRDVPRYIGSKNCALSTLFYGVAAVSFMSVSASSLRSLSEAAHHIESFALMAAFGHFLVHELGLNVEVAPSEKSK